MQCDCVQGGLAGHGQTLSDVNSAVGHVCVTHKSSAASRHMLHRVEVQKQQGGSQRRRRRQHQGSGRPGLAAGGRGGAADALEAPRGRPGRRAAVAVHPARAPRPPRPTPAPTCAQSWRRAACIIDHFNRHLDIFRTAR